MENRQIFSTFFVGNRQNFSKFFCEKQEKLFIIKILNQLNQKKQDFVFLPKYHQIFFLQVLFFFKEENIYRKLEEVILDFYFYIIFFMDNFYRR